MEYIYCLEDKPKDSYTKAEHVIPQSFGLFHGNFTLNQPHNKSVCDDCNQYFGDNLEINLGRDTVEGISRYEYGIREPEEFKSLGKRSRIHHKKIAEGVLKGAFFYEIPAAATQWASRRPVSGIRAGYCHHQEVADHL